MGRTGLALRKRSLLVAVIAIVLTACTTSASVRPPTSHVVKTSRPLPPPEPLQAVLVSGIYVDRIVAPACVFHPDAPGWCQTNPYFAPTGRQLRNFVLLLTVTSPTTFKGVIKEFDIYGQTSSVDFTFTGSAPTGQLRLGSSYFSVATITIQTSPHYGEGLGPPPKPGSQLTITYPANTQTGSWPAGFATSHSLTLQGCGGYLIQPYTPSDCDFVFSTTGSLAAADNAEY